MRRARLSLAVTVSMLAIGTVRADILFSDVVIQSDLGTVSVFSMGGGPYLDNIRFHFQQGAVGDIYDPVRSGNITVAYTAQADTDLLLSGLDFRANGAFSGSGLVLATGTVEDLESPGIIASSVIEFADYQPNPYLSSITFARSTARIRVTQSFDFTAYDTDDFDLARMSVITHELLQVPIPEPAALALLAIGSVALVRRR